MALDPTNVVLGRANQDGIWYAPTGTAPPADTTTPWGTGWISLGYVSEDGITLAQEVDSEDLTPWQSLTPIRTIVTSKLITIEMTLIEVKPEVLALFFDTDVPTATAGAFTLEVPTVPAQAEHAFGIDTIDGDTVIRYFFPRGTLSETGDVELTSGTAQGFPVTLKALGDGTGKSAVILKG